MWEEIFMKPIIGILAHQMVQKDGKFPGLERTFANQEYVVAVEKSGGIPLIIPMVESELSLEFLIKKVDAIILTGGNDVSPQFFNEEPKQKLGYITPDMDRFHLKAIEIAERLCKPIFGVCRGLQILNVAFGGTLYQDLSYFDGETIKHWQDSKRDAKVHKVTFSKGSDLSIVYGNDLMVNSFHHQCVNRLASKFKATAYSEDGIIEAIESNEYNYKLAVQWHPESMTADKEHDYKIFEFFINKIKIEVNFES